jgi:hypothetical protein
MYMGRDKYENDELIRYSFPEDVWFHVDEVSSAHVYLRFPSGGDGGGGGGPVWSIDTIPRGTLDDCMQLVKANSISGTKMKTVAVIYTFVSNLRKDQRMDTGTVGFHDERTVRRVPAVGKNAEVVKRIERTRTERTVREMEADRVRHDEEQRAQQKAETLKQRREAAESEKKAKADAELRAYTSVMKPEYMRSNSDAASSGQTAQQYEDDFM